MDRNFYKQAVISHVMITGWILYVFFDYLTARTTGFEGVGLFFLFFDTCVWVTGTGLVLIILRLTWFRKSRKAVLPQTMIYILAGIFNGYLVIIWITAFALGLLSTKSLMSIGYPLAALLPAAFILTDIYKTTRSKADGLTDPALTN